MKFYRNIKTATSKKKMIVSGSRHFEIRHKAVARIFVREGFDLPFPHYLSSHPFPLPVFPPLSFLALFLFSLAQSFPFPNPAREAGGAL